MRLSPIAATLLASSGVLLVAQEKAATPTPTVQMIVTVEARHGKEVPVLSQGDVMVFQKSQRLRVTNLVALQGDRAGLDLYILLDDASSSSLGSQLNDLRHFIDSQPAATSIGIGYLRNGTVEIAQNLTPDHARAAKALRLPLGSPGVTPSPFLALSDLIKRWPAGPVRHEVLVVTSGIDPLGGAIANPYLDAAIENAQRAGIVVYAIYMPAAGHSSHSPWRLNWGQNHLAQMGEETGGEAYMLGFEPPVSFAPYLTEVAEHLAHQYLVTFLAYPGNKPSFQAVRLTTEVPNAELVTAGKVYVPAAQAR
jgi:hypothetical protein